MSIELLEELVPDYKNTSLLAKAAVVFGVTLILSLVMGLGVRFLKSRAVSTVTPWDNVFLKSIGSPLQLLIWTVGVAMAMEISQIVHDTPGEKFIIAIRHGGVIFSIAWFLFRFVRRSEKHLVELENTKGKSPDRSVVQGMAKLIRLSISIATGLVALQTFGFSIAGVLTFGGVGGIAIGFAAKDMLSNFFGGLMIYLDRPFKIGDWVRSPDREIEGVVEEIGWRITRIRNFDSRPLYVPNSSFSTISIENVSRMTNRRIYETVGIRYDDATVVDPIVEQMTEYLENHDGIDQQQTLMVSFTAFAPSSLDLFIYCFTKTRAGPTFHKLKQEIMLQVLKIVEANGAECAFPTSTVYMNGPSSLQSLADGSNEQSLASEQDTVDTKTD